MKNRKMNRVVSLLLAAVMILALTFTLASCKDKNADAPVTAEAKLSNFVTFEGDGDKVLNKLNDLTKELGSLKDSSGNYAVFYKSDKDKMNVFTETYTLYSLKENKVMTTVSNSYVDEFEETEDDFGNDRYPEKEILGCSFLPMSALQIGYDIPIMLVAYANYTPIDEEIIEKEELSESYAREIYYEFYDITGKLITRTYTAGNGFGAIYYTNLVFNNCLYLPLGKQVAVFDLDTYELVDTFDGDVEALPAYYDATNEKYNYRFNVPAGYTDYLDEDEDPVGIQVLEVYNQKGKLVCSYSYGNEALYGHEAFVLDSGDVLIQYEEMFLEENADPNYITVILDVETGKVTEIADFDYQIYSVATKTEFDKYDALYDIDFKLTDNVRNILFAYDRNGTDYSIFMDNFGNVNYVFNGKLAYDAKNQPSVFNVEVLDKDHLLVRNAVTNVDGTATDIIVDADGKTIAYVPEGAEIFGNFIIIDEKLYDFNMKYVRDFYGDWANGFLDLNLNIEKDEDADDDDDDDIDEDYTDNLDKRTIIGNIAVFEFEYNVNDDFVTTESGVATYDMESGKVTRYEQYRYVATIDESLIVISKYNDNSNEYVYKFINIAGDCIFTYEAEAIDARNYAIVDTGVIITFYTDNGYLTVLIDSAAAEGGTN